MKITAIILFMFAMVVLPQTTFAKETEPKIVHILLDQEIHPFFHPANIGMDDAVALEIESKISFKNHQQTCTINVRGTVGPTRISSTRYMPHILAHRFIRLRNDISLVFVCNSNKIVVQLIREKIKSI